MTPSRPVWRFDAIGTRWEIETDEPLSAAVQGAVRDLVETFDRTWSRFRDDSLVSELARGAGSVPLPTDAHDMLEAYARVSDATGGAVNPLVGRSLERLGYDADYSFAAGAALTAPSDWRTLLAWDDDALVLREAAVVDVGALGKGRLVDRVLELLVSAVPGDIVVDASGDIAVRGGPQRIGLEHPLDASRAIGVVEVADGALCASATNRRAWTSPLGETLHHVLDARTGEPVRTVLATWAMAPTAMQADAISTALFFDGGARLAHDERVEWVRMLTDGRVEHSAASKAELFT